MAAAAGTGHLLGGTMDRFIGRSEALDHGPGQLLQAFHGQVQNRLRGQSRALRITHHIDPDPHLVRAHQGHGAGRQPRAHPQVLHELVTVPDALPGAQLGSQRHTVVEARLGIHQRNDGLGSQLPVRPRQGVAKVPLGIGDQPLILDLVMLVRELERRGAQRDGSLREGPVGVADPLANAGHPLPVSAATHPEPVVAVVKIEELGGAGGGEHQLVKRLPSQAVRSPERGERYVRPSGSLEARIQLVGKHGQLVRDDDIRDGLHLLPAHHLEGGVVGVGQQQGADAVPTMLLDGRFEDPGSEPVAGVARGDGSQLLTQLGRLALDLGEGTKVGLRNEDDLPCIQKFPQREVVQLEAGAGERHHFFFQGVKIDGDASIQEDVAGRGAKEPLGKHLGRQQNVLGVALQVTNHVICLEGIDRSEVRPPADLDVSVVLHHHRVAAPSALSHQGANARLRGGDHRGREAEPRIHTREVDGRSANDGGRRQDGPDMRMGLSLLDVCITNEWHDGNSRSEGVLVVIRRMFPHLPKSESGRRDPRCAYAPPNRSAILSRSADAILYSDEIEADDSARSIWGQQRYRKAGAPRQLLQRQLLRLARFADDPADGAVEICFGVGGQALLRQRGLDRLQQRGRLHRLAHIVGHLRLQRGDGGVHGGERRGHDDRDGRVRDEPRVQEQRR